LCGIYSYNALNIKIDFIQKNVERKCNQLEETG